MIVCICNRLNEAKIRSAISGGLDSSEDVYARCGVRKNCGRCQETIEKMMDDAQPRQLVAAE